MGKYEPGRYMLRVSNQGFGEANNEKKTPFFFLQGTPVALIHSDGNQYAVDDEGPRTISLYLTDKTVEGTAAQLKKLGWLGGKWSTLDPNNGGYHNFAEQEIEVRCYMEPGVKDATKLYEKWELPFGGGQPTESDSKVASKLDAMFGKSAATKATTPIRKPAPSRAAADPNAALQEAAASGDDVPF